MAPFHPALVLLRAGISVDDESRAGPAAERSVPLVDSEVQWQKSLQEADVLWRFFCILTPGVRSCRKSD